VTSESFSKIVSHLDRELWLITSRSGGRQSGLIVTYVSSVSLVPSLPRVTIALAKHHFTHELISQSKSFCMHLISEQQIDWVWHFGIQTGRDTHKLGPFTTGISRTGAPVLTQALAWADCRVEAKLDIGDRTLFLGEVLDANLQQGARPLTFKRLLEIAPPDKLAELKSAMQHDIEVDRLAILDWRRGEIVP